MALFNRIIPISSLTTARGAILIRVRTSFDAVGASAEPALIGVQPETAATIQIMTPAVPSILRLTHELMLSLVEQQESKVLAMGRRIHPGLTNEDIRNPQDFEDLASNPQWNFEDGILAGIRSAHMALRARLIELCDREGL